MAKLHVFITFFLMKYSFYFLLLSLAVLSALLKTFQIQFHDVNEEHDKRYKLLLN
jgi:hypothetical protein